MAAECCYPTYYKRCINIWSFLGTIQKSPIFGAFPSSFAHKRSLTPKRYAAQAHNLTPNINMGADTGGATNRHGVRHHRFCLVSGTLCKPRFSVRHPCATPVRGTGWFDRIYRINRIGGRGWRWEERGGMLRIIVVFKHHAGIASRFANTVFDKKFFFAIAHISFHQPCDVVYEEPTNLVFITSSRREKTNVFPQHYGTTQDFGQQQFNASHFGVVQIRHTQEDSERSSTSANHSLSMALKRQYQVLSRLRCRFANIFRRKRKKGYLSIRNLDKAWPRELPTRKMGMSPQEAGTSHPSSANTKEYCPFSTNAYIAKLYLRNSQWSFPFDMEPLYNIRCMLRTFFVGPHQPL